MASDNLFADGIMRSIAIAKRPRVGATLSAEVVISKSMTIATAAIITNDSNHNRGVLLIVPLMIAMRIALSWAALKALPK